MRQALLANVTLSVLISSSATLAIDGASVYAEHCASCHDSGAPRTPTRDTLKALSPDTIVQALETGAMRVIGQWNLDGPERIAVAEYLSEKTYNSSWRDTTTNLCEKKISSSADPFAAPHWNGWGVDDSNSRFQPAAMAGIEKSDIAKLRLKWVFAFPGETVVEAQPTVVDGRIYIGSRSGTFYVLDAESGCTYWTYQAGAPIKNAPRIESVGEHNHLVAFFGDISGWLYAVDALTGDLIWKLRSEDHPAARTTGGFQYSEGALYIGVSSLEEGLSTDPEYPCCSFRGSVLKIDAPTGRVVWQTYTIDEVATPQGVNSRGKQTIGPSGASVWSAVTLDRKLRRLYVATSDNYSNPATNTSDSILALSMDTGSIEWVYQGLVGDVWNSACHVDDQDNCPDNTGPDEDMGSSPMLVNLASGKRVLAAGQKTGVLHVLDPDDNGRLLWRKKIAEGGILGGIEWGPATDGKHFYVAKADATWRDQRFISADTELNPNTGGGTVAVDAASGEIVWEAPPVSCDGRKNCSPAQTAAVTVIPGVVFSGSLSGILQAFDTDTGEKLWHYDTVQSYESVNGAKGSGGAIDGPGVVVADGWVYVTSGYAKFGGLAGNVLLAFSKAK
jgi:polyvinyl alcohol dehydrogenase (cytochrome)